MFTTCTIDKVASPRAACPPGPVSKSVVSKAVSARSTVWVVGLGSVVSPRSEVRESHDCHSTVGQQQPIRSRHLRKTAPGSTYRPSRAQAGRRTCPESPARKSALATGMPSLVRSRMRSASMIWTGRSPQVSSRRRMTGRLTRVRRSGVRRDRFIDGEVGEMCGPSDQEIAQHDEGPSIAEHVERRRHRTGRTKLVRRRY